MPTAVLPKSILYSDNTFGIVFKSTGITKFK